MDNKLDERLEIIIDPDTLNYSIQCENIYLEDIYIVLRDIVQSIEDGDARNFFRLENSSGEQASKEQIITSIQYLKQQIDQNIEQGFTDDLVRDYKN